jgi:hypothetical protein
VFAFVERCESVASGCGSLEKRRRKPATALVNDDDMYEDEGGVGVDLPDDVGVCSRTGDVDIIEGCG